MTKTKNLDVSGAAVNHLSAVIGAVVSIASLVSLITSKSLKVWVRQNSYLVFVLLLASILLSFVIIDFVANRRRAEGNQHDRATVAHILQELPSNSQIVIWLKESFISKSIPIRYCDALDRVLSRMRLNVVGLDNHQADRSYRRLQAAIDEFLGQVNFNLFSNSDYTVLVNSPEWPWEQWDKASKEINSSEQELVKAYDEFLCVCHRHHLD